MHPKGFWISGDYVSGAAARLPSRPRAIVAQQTVPVCSGPDGPATGQPCRRLALSRLPLNKSVEAVGKGQRLFSALNRSIIKLKIAPILKIQSTYRGKQT